MLVGPMNGDPLASDPVTGGHEAAGQGPDSLAPAPYFADIAEGPEGVEAWWTRAEDGTRLRLAVWPRGPRGTVVMFPGRTEYVEKYGRLAGDMAQAGYGMVAFDWRGQGLADRPAHDRGMGHVTDFTEYGRDVAAFRAAMERLDLPRPWYLIGHSMGGCIGLRALYDGLPVLAAAFTGPMWGLQMSPLLRLASPVILAAAGPLGLATSYAPSTGPWAPIPFEDNALTTDTAQHAYMERQTREHPELALGGPSYGWVRQALRETAELMAMPPLDLPVVTVMGDLEQIVSPEAARARMASWPRGRYLGIDGARHEVLMESPDRRGQTLDAILGLFAAHPA